MSKKRTEYFKHSFSLSESQIDKIRSAIKDKLPTTVRLQKKSFVDGAIELPLTKNDAMNVVNNKGFDYVLTKCKIKMLKIDEKNGGFLPIPIILAGIAALTSGITAAAKIADTVIQKQNNDMRFEEEKRANQEREKILGESSGSAIFLSPWKNGTSIHVKEFTSRTKLDPIAQRTLRAFLKNLNTHIMIQKQGDGLFLSPYGSS
jgi:hypothetical protein